MSLPGTLIDLIIKVTKDSVGAQGRQSQDLPQWHIDYFELQSLKKLPLQKENSNICVPLKTENKSP